MLTEVAADGKTDMVEPGLRVPQKNCKKFIELFQTARRKTRGLVSMFEGTKPKVAHPLNFEKFKKKNQTQAFQASSFSHRTR